MSCANYLGLAAALLLLIPAGALAKEKSEHNLKLDEAVQVGSAQLPPGNYTGMAGHRSGCVHQLPAEWQNALVHHRPSGRER